MFYNTIYNTHDTHTNTLRSTSVPRIYNVSWLPAARAQFASHTDSVWSTFQLPLHPQLRLNIYTTAVCGWCNILA